MYTQVGRLVIIETVLPPDELLLESIDYVEQVSQPFLLKCTVLVPNKNLDVNALLWANACVKVRLLGEEYRPIHGLIRSVQYVEDDKHFAAYKFEIVPYFWFLSLNRECRVFHSENMPVQPTVPEIIKTVLLAYPHLNTEWHLIGDYPAREFCVQYQESDFQFISRLLEEEGIFYFFRHTPTGHAIVFADCLAVVKPCQDSPVPFDSNKINADRMHRVVAIRESARARARSVALGDYNFLTPSHDLRVTSGSGRSPEQFYYPGNYPDSHAGARYARLRIEESEWQSRTVAGDGNNPFFRSGARFTLERHELARFNDTYFVLQVRHTAKTNHYRSTAEPNAEVETYKNTWEGIQYPKPFRPQRITPKPRIPGTQTAVVVGERPLDFPDPDEHGRVKVHFFRDRYSRKDGKDSCWVRVSQPWAGRNWGTVSIPRIGQEVIVEFLDGDPDRPIITGRVYNEEMRPPYPLPAGASNMGFRSRSIGGGGYNEISVNDTNTNEGITIHAENDMSTVVENNETIHVKKNRSEKVGVDEAITIGNNRTEQVGVNESITIGNNRQTSIGSHEVLTVGSTRTQSVGINEMIHVGAAQQVNVGALQLITVGLAQMVNVGVKQTTHAGSEILIDAPKILLSGNEMIEIKCGGGSIKIDAGGNIEIKGTLVKVNC